MADEKSTKTMQPEATKEKDDDLYTPPDQSLFDFATKGPDRITEQRKREKEQLAKQQRTVVLVLGIVVALLVVGGLVAIVVNTLSSGPPPG